MGFDHRLSTAAVVKDGVTLEQVQRAFLPLTNYFGDSLRCDLSLDEESGSIHFHSEGTVSHNFDELVQEVAGNLGGMVVKGGFFKLLDDSTVNPDEYERFTPIGTPEMIKAAQEREARMAAILAIQGYTGSGLEAAMVVVDGAKARADKERLLVSIPSPSNASRAFLCMAAVNEFCEATGLDVSSDGLETVLVDLTGGLMHLCAANGIDFESMHRMASTHFEAEVAEEADLELAACREIGEIAHSKAIVEFTSARPVDRKCSGKVMGVNDFYTALSVGLNALVIPNKVLDRVPAEGESVSIDFKGGAGRVSSPEQGKGKGVGR